MNINNKLKKISVVPDKLRGQCFLIDDNVVNKIISASNINKKDIVLEVGPGLGIMTAELVKKAKKVIAVEIDKKLASALSYNFKQAKNLKIVNEDILKSNIECMGLQNGKYKIVANLPYNITSRFFRVFLDPLNVRPKYMIVMIQKEVANRMIAKPGNMSKLAVMAQLYADISRLFDVSKNCFYPSPAVESTVIKIDIKQKLPDMNKKVFFRLVSYGFSSKRKQLQNNLAAGMLLDRDLVKIKLKQVGLDEKVRAQELSVENWLELTKLFE